MPDLFHTLQKHDLGFLKMVADGWGIELSAPDVHTALPALVEAILNFPMIYEWVEALPEEAQNALSVLIQNEGRMPWAAFARQFGELRRMGASRRDRERPDLKPAWTTELLWYRALIGRDIFDPQKDIEPVEYAYIPEDLIPLLPVLRPDSPPPPGRPATPNECAYPALVNSRILDDACTLLAALRMKINAAEQQDCLETSLMVRPQALQGLLAAAHLLDYEETPHPDSTRAFLEAPRGKALAQLAQAWMESKHFNELRLLPGLKFEGEWLNDPLRARQAILELASQVPENQWWNLTSFISAVHEHNPDFQRPAGDYDSWFIRQENSGNYLRGFNSWEEVDGALIRFLLTGPMHWLGLLDLASSEPSGAPAAFRLSGWASALWHGDAPTGLPEEDAPLRASAEGRLYLPALTSRAVRYQVARFCQWEGMKSVDGKMGYAYRVTPEALERAKTQGLRPSQLLALLRRHIEAQVPPTLVQALERWEQAGTQVAVERVVLLRVTSPEIMAALRKRTRRALSGERDQRDGCDRPPWHGRPASGCPDRSGLSGRRKVGWDLRSCFSIKELCYFLANFSKNNTIP